jgi:hypothetical protein
MAGAGNNDDAPGPVLFEEVGKPTASIARTRWCRDRTDRNMRKFRPRALDKVVGAVVAIHIDKATNIDSLADHYRRYP